MAEESLSPVSQFTAVIPHFWYDIIGQMVPGSYLIAGLYWLGFKSEVVTRFISDYLTTITKDGKEIQEIHFFPLLVVFGFAAYFVGGVLGPFSHWLVQWPIMKCRTVKVPKATLQVLNHIFGDMAANENEVEELRHQCTWIIWKRAPTLAIIFSRWDAMAFASRSVALSSFILFVCVLYLHYFASQMMTISQFAGTSLILATIGGGAILSFAHFRTNALRARFEMAKVVQDDEKIRKPSLSQPFD